MKLLFRFVFVCALLLPLNNLVAQSPFFRKHSLPLEFKNSGITCIIQDKDQFIWFGTTIGLVRFNGLTYKHFLEFPGKPNEVTSLFEDRKGTLWIGYKDGKVGRLQNETFIVDSLTQFPSVPVTGFSETPDSAVWVSTYGEGFLIFSNGQTKSFTTNEGLSDNFVYATTTDNAGNVFAGTDQGVSVSNPESRLVKVTSSANGLRDNIITAMDRDANSIIWLGSESEGIAAYDPEKQRIDYPYASWPFGRVTSVLALQETLWVGTSTHGVIEVDKAGKFLNQLGLEDKTIPSRIISMARDAEGNIWLSSGSGSVFSGNPLFSFISRSQNRDHGNIQAVLYCKEGNILFSTTTGVYSLRPHQTASLPEKLNVPGLNDVQVISMFQDSSGGIWFGTFDKGVFYIDPKKNRSLHFTEKDGLVNNNVLSIVGRGNEIWFATLGGVSQCFYNGNSAEFKNYTSESGLGSNYIYKIFIDSKDRIWFATDGKGISVREKGSFRNYSLSEGLKSSIVYSVTEDSSGTIWVSTSNAGIFRFNGTAFESFAPHNGLRDLNISSVIGEKNGGILIVSRQGIDILTPKSGMVLYHDQEFGINDIDPNLNAYSKDPDGNIWLATQQGIIKYNTQIRISPKWPVTRINEMQILLSKADTTVKEIPFARNHVSFDYTGFWYRDPEDVSYRIKLEGYDREWINSRNHFITYPNLPPGKYTFMVQSSSTNHFRGASVKRYSFVISPPFYKTLWFYGLCILSGLSIIYLVVTTREKNLKAKQRAEKEKIEFQFETLKNQVNPHFLFNSFNTLIGVIEEDKETAVEYVIKLSDFYRDILVNREKETIPLSKELELINNYYFLQVKRYKENFKMFIDVPDERLNEGIPPLTLQLLVENAIKHNIISREKPLHILIKIENDYLMIRNNLQRKVLHEPSTGVGLSNIVNRLELLTDKPVQIDETSEYFTVLIPLLKS